MKIACTDRDMFLTDSKSGTDELAGRGISYMEIAMSKLPEDEAVQDEIVAYALSRGLTLNLHAPYGINNIACADSARRTSSIANVKRTIDLAAKYHLGTVTFHPGRMSDDADTPEEAWARLMDAASDIARYAKEKKVFVSIENMELRPYELVYTVEDLNRFAPLAENNPYFGVTVDYAHYASHGIGLPDLSALKLPIYDVHLSRIVDGLMHCALSGGEGEPDVGAVCRQLTAFGYDGLVVLEVRDHVWESIETLEAELKTLV